METDKKRQRHVATPEVEEVANLHDIIRDPNVWGRAKLFSLRLADVASDIIFKSRGESQLRGTMSAVIGAMNCALFFADALRLSRKDMEGIVARTIHLHYAPENSKPPARDRLADVIPLRREEK